MATTADTSPVPGAVPGPVTSPAADEGKLPVALKLGWATGAFGIALLMNGIAGVLLLFAVSMLGIDPWLAGAIITVSKVFDAVTDPVVGMWSDRLRSPRGRRRPFLTWGAVLSAVSFAIIFTTPQFANQYVTAAYLFGALCLYAFGYTLFNIPYMSMPAEMTDSYHERSSIHAYRMVFVALGGMAAGAGIKIALDALGSTEARSWAIVGCVCAAAIFITLMTTYLSTASARFTNAGEDSEKNKFEQLGEEFGAVVGNRHFLRLIGVKFSQLMGVQTMGAAMAYFFVQYLQQDFTTLGLFFIVVSVSTIVCSPLLVMFSKTYGKKAAYYVAAAVNIAYALSWTFSGPDDPVWMILGRGLLVGVAFSGNVIMAMSMLTDIINEDAGRSGVRREGAFTALYSFVEKVTGAFGPLIVGVALTYVGFDKSLPFDVPQGDNVNTALLLAVSWLPAIFYLIAVGLLTGYDLTEKDINSAKIEKEFS